MAKFNLVQHCDIDRLQQPGRMARIGRQVEHRPCSGLVRPGKNLARGGKWRFELGDPDFIAPRRMAQHLRPEVHVGAGRYGDRVISIGNLD